jgi:hypothetical protein
MKTITVLAGGCAEEALRKAGALAVYLDLPDLFEH